MDQQEQDRIIQEHQANQEKLQTAIQHMEKHVRKNQDGTFELKAKNAREAGVDQEAFEQLRQSLELGNQQIKQGKVRANDVRAKTGKPEEDDPHRGKPDGPSKPDTSGRHQART